MNNTTVLRIEDEARREVVFRNLDDAAENGAFGPGEHLDGYTDLDIAQDMVAFAEDCEDYQPEQLVPYVVEWRKHRSGLS